jgi:GntR family transcriptional regulator/MocR family aminotransferase
MLTYDLSQRGELSLYDYLYRCIKQDILAGHIRAGERLPSKRQLAAHLKISVITVEGAYAQLLTEGYIRSQEKSGYFAEAVTAPQQVTSSTDMVTAPPPSPWFLDLTSNHLNTEDFPFSLWAKEVRRVLLDEGDRLVEPVPYNGTAALREAIARYLHRFRGLQVHPEQIVVGAGTEYLYGLLVQLLGRERVFALEDPGYRKIAAIYRLNGVTCRHLPVDGQGLSVDRLLSSDATVAHLSPAHHFPSGAVMPVGRRQALLEWAYEGDRYLIEDDYDSEFRMSGRPIPPLAALDSHGRVIYINTFSKSLSPSMRMGYLILPEHLLSRYDEVLGNFSCTVPVLDQYILAEFIESGNFERHLNRMRRKLKNTEL